MMPPFFDYHSLLVFLDPIHRSRYHRKPTDHGFLFWESNQTALLHEIRHFHDFLGTTFGLALLGNWLELIEVFITQVDVSRKSGFLSIPLFDKALADEASKGNFVEYMKLVQIARWKKKFYYQNIKKKQVDVQNMDRFSCVRISFPGGRSISIPASKYSWQDGNKFFEVDIPQSGKAIFESIAFVIQKRGIGHLFGAECADAFDFLPLYAGCKNEEQLIYRATPHMVAEKIKPKFTEPFLQLADVALNGTFGDCFVSFHPGWRLVSLLDNLSQGACRDAGKTGKIDQDALNESIDKSGYSFDEPLFFGGIIKKLQDAIVVFNAAGLNPYKFMSIAYRLSIELMQCRLENKNYFWNIDEYLSLYCSLPAPILIDKITGEPTPSQNFEEDEVDVILSMSFLSSIAGDLLFSQEAICPLNKLKTFCSLRIEGCGKFPEYTLKNHGCTFHGTIYNLGLYDLHNAFTD